MIASNLPLGGLYITEGIFTFLPQTMRYLYPIDSISLIFSCKSFSSLLGIKKKILDKDTAAEIKEESKKTGKKPEELIVGDNIIPEGELFKLKSEFIKVPLKEEKVGKITKEALAVIPRESVEFYKMAEKGLIRYNIFTATKCPI